MDVRAPSLLLHQAQVCSEQHAHLLAESQEIKERNEREE